MLGNIEKKNVFITSNPAVGKTRLIKEVCMPYVEYLGGFYTEEIREEPCERSEGGQKLSPQQLSNMAAQRPNKWQSKRVGFKLKTFSGEEGILAYKGMKSQYRLNKYGIDLKVIEELGVKSMLAALQNKKVIVIDEIGTMECYSDLFRKTVVECLNSTKNVLATIRYKAQPFTDEVKRMANTELILLTTENYLELKQLLRSWLHRISELAE
ncbi:MAG: nucleoside-triphosphatase [Elusimicrobiota bacterium]|nr:nucleoside-triphosphatase [Elusimicrobiota bacterium]